MLVGKIFVLLIFLLSSAHTQIQCPSVCSTCSSNYVCTACISRYLLVNAKCLPCPQNCLTCNSQGKCLTCVSGTQLKEEKCLKCSNNCNQCSNTPANCSSCISPLILTDKICNYPPTCTLTNCELCQLQILSNSSSNKVCQTCYSGFYSYDIKCHPCPYPCQNCNYTINETAVESFINTKLKAKYPSATEIVFSTYSKWQQENLYQIYVLDLMLKNLGNPNNTAIQEKLYDLGIIVASGVNPKRLTAAQKISFLSIISNTKYNIDNIQSKLLQEIQQAFTCSTCSGPYFVQNGACVKCSLGCLTCTSTTVCTGCQNGFALISHACERCKSPCNSCYGSVTNCTDCIKPYSLDVNFTCQICIPSSCEKCSTNLALCESCLSPYSYIPSAGVCYRCEQDLCYQCSSSRTSQCLECYPGSALTSQKKCLSCPEFCSVCSANQSTSSLSCWKCKDGYTLQNGVCNSCGFGCIECSVFDKQICLSCGPRTFLNPFSKCQKCPDGCEECSTFYGVCIRYQPGLTSFNNQTTRCNTGCRTCNFKDPLVCWQCLSSYYLSSGNCEKCSQFCVQCSSSTVCTKCQTNINLVSSQCKLCEGNCATCEAANLKNCLSCRRGYVIDEETKACSISCGSGCASCTFRDMVSTCTKCNSGYALKKDGTCIKCMEGCTGSCDPKDVTKCLSCNSNSEMNKLFKCDRCPTGCSRCLKQHCLSCAEGFTLTQQSNKMICKQKCSYPCSTCDSTSCLKCMTGYKLTDGQCEYNTTYCNPDCQYCLPGSFSSSSRCEACELGCSTCTNATVCTSCFEKYYLAAGKCKKCPAKCKTCISQTECISCGPGYFKQVLETDSSTPTYLPNCLACSEKCRTCSFSADQCDSCRGQFTIKDSQCFGRNRVKFTFKFDRDFAQFLLASQSQVIRAKIAQILKIYKSNILITQLKSGSTILGGQISADTNAQAVTLSDQLYNAVAQNNNILGYPVTEKNIGAYYDDSKVYETSTSKGYTGIIIGCSIAVVAAIVITIIACVCIKKRKTTKQQKYQQQQGQGQNRRNKFGKYEYKANLQLKETTNNLDDSVGTYHGIQFYK